MSERRSSGDFGLRLHDDAWITCHRYEHNKPILSVHGPGVHLSLSPTGFDGSPVTGGDLRVAERLLRAAQTYLSELQRLQAAQSTQRADVA